MIIGAVIAGLLIISLFIEMIGDFAKIEQRSSARGKATQNSSVWHISKVAPTRNAAELRSHSK
jgi:hypothetical protein